MNLVGIGIGGGDVAHAVNGDGSKFRSGRQGQDTFVAHTLRAEGHDASEDGTGRGVPLVFATTFARNGRGAPSEVSPTLEHGGGGSRIDRRPTLLQRSTVRRLTPRECERLQGFSDDWTRYKPDGTEISDSARYRMIGNSIAIPVVEWITKRIAAVHAANFTHA